MASPEKLATCELCPQFGGTPSKVVRGYTLCEGHKCRAKCGNARIMNEDRTFRTYCGACSLQWRHKRANDRAQTIMVRKEMKRRLLNGMGMEGALDQTPETIHSESAFGDADDERDPSRGFEACASYPHLSQSVTKAMKAEPKGFFELLTQALTDAPIDTSKGPTPSVATGLDLSSRLLYFTFQDGVKRVMVSTFRSQGISAFAPLAPTDLSFSRFESAIKQATHTTNGNLAIWALSEDGGRTGYQRIMNDIDLATEVFVYFSGVEIGDLRNGGRPAWYWVVTLAGDAAPEVPQQTQLRLELEGPKTF